MKKIVLSAALIGLVAMFFYGKDFMDLHPKIKAILHIKDEITNPIRSSNLPLKHPVESHLKKCIQGHQIIYTDAFCPSGFKEEELRAGSLTILPSQLSNPSTTAKQGNETASQGAQNRLQEALDIKTDAKLKGKIIDKAIE